MIRIALGMLITLFLFSCGEKKETSTKEKEKVTNRSFFYTYDTIPKIYQYREVVNGMYEQFHRVYGVSRGDGKHIILERFTEDGRLTETYDFVLDSLSVFDHMEVNVKGDLERAFVYHNRLFPLDNNETHFATKFSGILDVNVLLYESFRKFNSFTKREVLSKSLECMKLNERIRVTNINTDSKMQNESLNDIVIYFGKSIGLVEWHDKDYQQHFVLEKIISQDEWFKLISG